MISKDLHLFEQKNYILETFFDEIHYVAMYPNNFVSKFNKIIPAYREVSKVFDLKNAYITRYKIDEKYNNEFYSSVFKAIFLIKDTGNRNKIFNWTIGFLNNYNLVPGKNDIKKIAYSFFKAKEKLPLTFLKKKFPEVNIDNNDLFKELCYNTLTRENPSNKVKVLHSLFKEYDIKKIKQKKNLFKKTTILSSLLSNIKIMPKNLPSAIKEILVKGDSIFLHNVEKIANIIPDNTNKDLILRELKEIFIDFYDKNKNDFLINSSKRQIIDIAHCLSNIIKHYDKKEQDILLNVFIPDSQDEKSNEIRRSVLFKATMAKTLCPTDKYKECNELYEDNTYDFHKKRPLFFYVINRFYVDTDKCIKFLQNNKINYYASDEDNQDIVTFLKKQIETHISINTSVDKKDLKVKLLNKIKVFCEAQQLNQESENELNL